MVRVVYVEELCVKPRLLDLFCGAGGASMGYHRAGFDVVGVDIKPQPNYPFEFVQSDALAAPVHPGSFDAVHASPPCQAFTTMNNRHGSSSPPLISETRELLEASGLPWIIENVPGARSEMRSTIRLAGEQFGLGVHRPRLFESNTLLLAPMKVARQGDAAAVYGKQDGRRLRTRTDGSELRVATLERGAEAMGIHWMTWNELKEAIPPAYTEYLGQFLMAAMRKVRA